MYWSKFPETTLLFRSFSFQGRKEVWEGVDRTISRTWLDPDRPRTGSWSTRFVGSVGTFFDVFDKSDVPWVRSPRLGLGLGLCLMKERVQKFKKKVWLHLICVCGRMLHVRVLSGPWHVLRISVRANRSIVVIVRRDNNHCYYKRLKEGNSFYTGWH